MIFRLILQHPLAALLPSSVKTALLKLSGQRPAFVYVTNTPKSKRIN
ncbi:MAG: hypothetical protein V4619_02990 [Bacteroidota bacterium]